MDYKFLLTYTPTSEAYTTAPRECKPLRGNDLAISIDKASGEWYYTRKLDGKITFVNQDYEYIMSRPFDGTFLLTLQNSTDEGTSWHKYFEGTFSRANLEIDEDNHTAVLNGVSEGVYSVIDNAKGTEYDLAKLIPDADTKEVQGHVQPALALEDYRQAPIEKTDIYCGGPTTADGYRSAYRETEWNENTLVTSTSKWHFVGIRAEAKVEMTDPDSPANGTYAGTLSYQSYADGTKRVPTGLLTNANGYQLSFHVLIGQEEPTPIVGDYLEIILINDGGTDIATARLDATNITNYSPTSLIFNGSSLSNLSTATIIFHYIRAALLTQSVGDQYNVIDTSDYYKRMQPFEGSGLTIASSLRTVEQPNGHSMVPGSDDNGATPQYFAPPDNSSDWIPLAENNWNYASLWYKIVPSVQNGLLDTANVGTTRWLRCWTLGTCLSALLGKITGGEVVFNENANYSRFLYDLANPVAQGEPFEYLITQKSNVMRPSTTGATRCIVTLGWFLELLRNAFNCYYWLEKRADNRYNFRVEHIEFFRRGGRYSGDPVQQLNLTTLKPYRNFSRLSQPVKRFADGTNHYTFELNDLAQQYTFSWQGEGGSDDFKGNPMFFKAGWIERGKSESHEVDNIFADLSWLMLTSGTATASSRNYDGIFLFAAYRTANDNWSENAAPQSAALGLLSGTMINAQISLTVTVPAGQTFQLVLTRNLPQFYSQVLKTYTGTGKPQTIAIEYEYAFIVPHVLGIDFGAHYANVVIHRVQSHSGNVYHVANTANLLRSGYLQNGPLAWPWLQTQYLHYDIPAALWSYDSDDIDTATFQTTDSIKLNKKQSVGIVPCLTADPDTSHGVRTGLGLGIIQSARVNLASRNCEMELIYALAHPPAVTPIS